MGNHTIECDYCGEDTRGLSGVRGCDTQAEANKCYSYKKNKEDWNRYPALDSVRSNTKNQIAGRSAFNSDEERAAYIRGAEAMRQRCADHLRQRAEEEAQHSRMISSAACSRLAQEVEAMNVVVPERAEDW